MNIHYEPKYGPLTNPNFLSHNPEFLFHVDGWDVYRSTKIGYYFGLANELTTPWWIYSTRADLRHDKYGMHLLEPPVSYGKWKAKYTDDMLNAIRAHYRITQ